MPARVPEVMPGRARAGILFSTKRKLKMKIDYPRHLGPRHPSGQWPVHMRAATAKVAPRIAYRE